MFRSMPNNVLTDRKFVLICFKYIGEKIILEELFLFFFPFFVVVVVVVQRKI